MSHLLISRLTSHAFSAGGRLSEISRAMISESSSLSI